MLEITDVQNHVLSTTMLMRRSVLVPAPAIPIEYQYTSSADPRWEGGGGCVMVLSKSCRPCGGSFALTSRQSPKAECSVHGGGGGNTPFFITQEAEHLELSPATRSLLIFVRCPARHGGEIHPETRNPRRERWRVGSQNDLSTVALQTAGDRSPLLLLLSRLAPTLLRKAGRFLPHPSSRPWATVSQRNFEAWFLPPPPGLQRLLVPFPGFGRNWRGEWRQQQQRRRRALHKHYHQQQQQQQCVRVGRWRWTRKQATTAGEA